MVTHKQIKNMHNNIWPNVRALMSTRLTDRSIKMKHVKLCNDTTTTNTVCITFSA